MQAPTKYELVINLKAAKALGITAALPDGKMHMSSGRSSFSTNLVSSVTPSFSIAIADEVIEGCDQCRGGFRNVLD